DGERLVVSHSVSDFAPLGEVLRAAQRIPCRPETAEKHCRRRGTRMRYEGSIYRPPSEADAYILQATVGCSWNACVYCDMYREKTFRVRALEESLEDLKQAAALFGPRVRKVFVADGDALILPTEHWHALLAAARAGFPRLERVSCYAMARNILDKTPEELRALREA